MNDRDKDRIECAIRHIQSSLDVDTWACEIAVEAMKKQIPQKPKRINKNGTFDGNWKKVCPECGFVFVERVTTHDVSYPTVCRRLNYCTCGQAIDWAGWD